RSGRGAAERRAHRLLIIQQAQEILASLADHDAAALLHRVGVEPVEFAGDLALQVAGEGRDPHRALISFGPEARRRDIAQGLADAGAGLGEHRLRLVRALPRRKSSRDGGGVIGLLRPRLGVLAEQGGEPAARLIRADRIVAGGWRRGASASPRGVGTQNCAGRTKANNSSRSNAAKPAQSLAQPFEGISSRRATARAWHTIGVSPPCTGSSRARASSGDNASISPSGDSHNTSRNPATSAGTRGTSTRSS